MTNSDLKLLDDFVKTKAYNTCVTHLRTNTHCYSLIEFICEHQNNKNNKDPHFWDNYAIACFYLGKRNKSFNIYHNIFSNSPTSMVESSINHYINNMKYSIPNNMKKKCDANIAGINKQLGDSVVICNMTNDIINKLDQNYRPLNPSILFDRKNDEYIVNIRTTNYYFDEKFRMHAGSDCMTINQVAKYDSELREQKSLSKQNNFVLPYEGSFGGCEDIRLFFYKNTMHCSFTSLSVCQNRIQCICVGNTDTGEYNVLNGYGNGIPQKNWVPIVTDDALYFIYSFYPLIVLIYDDSSKNVKPHQCTLSGMFNDWRGGTPAISLKEMGYDDYFLCVVHGKSRFPLYDHIFVLLKYKNNTFEIYNNSPKFYFLNTLIEFCSGITLSKNMDEFILTFGKLDKEIYNARIDSKRLLSCMMNQNNILIKNPHIIHENDMYENMRSPYTFVTGYFGENTQEYYDTCMEKGKFILEKDIDLVFYSDNDTAIEFVNNARTKLKQHTHTIKINTHDISTCNTKIRLVNDAITNMYFNNEYYMWIDFTIANKTSIENYLPCFFEKSNKISTMKINETFTNDLFCGSKNNMMMLYEKIADEPTADIYNIYLANPESFECYYGETTDIINNRIFMYTKNSVQMLLKTINNLENMQKYDEAKHILRYVLVSFYDGHLDLSDEEHLQFDSYWSRFFYK